LLVDLFGAMTTVHALPRIIEAITQKLRDSVYPANREAGILALALLIGACIAPRFGNRLFERAEQLGSRLAEKEGLAILSVAATAILLRLALLPWIPIPVPEIQDEFSHLLVADTFLHGRLTNPPHPMWIYFDTFQVSQHPTYMSMYPPAQGAVLALGHLLGHPWIGVLLSVAAMCAAIVWALQGWVPSRWALLGGILMLLRLAVSSYWVNSYWGGAVAATGGALAIGALPRIIRCRRPRDAVMLGLGATILANSRPYEGFIFCLPVIAALLLWLAKDRLALRADFLRIILPLGLVLAVCIVFMLYFNAEGTGNPFLFPYVLNVTSHFAVPQTIFQKARAPFHFLNPQFEDYYNVWWLRVAWRHGHPNTLRHIVATAASNTKNLVNFFAWPEFCVVLFAAPWLLRDKRVRLLILQVLVCFAGFLSVAWIVPHYAAALTATLAVLLVQGIRHIRVSRFRGRPTGIALSRAIMLAAILLTPFHTIRLYTHPSVDARAGIASQLDRTPVDHLVIVRYSPRHNSEEEWVYNGADIDHSKTVWAREIPGIDMQPLLDYFHGRNVWLVEPDEAVPHLSPYIPAP
jgi:hypothetical protein